MFKSMERVVLAEGDDRYDASHHREQERSEVACQRYSVPLLCIIVLSFR